ncbi:MAG: glycosyltransferase family 9 protein [Bacteroidetes bacterium]|nr:glycosyltransferase family 9 protein [Bacteroidota bacterium]
MPFPKNFKEKFVYFFSMFLTRWVNRNKNIRSFSFERILVIREDEIGDLCYSLHIFKSLKKQFPNSKITLLCKPFAVSLVKNDPSVDHVTSNWSELTGDYDLIVDLRGSCKSIWYACTHAPKIRLDRGTVRYRNKKKGSHPHEVQTNLEVIEPLLDETNKAFQPELFFGQDEIKKANEFLLANNIGSFAVLHTGARRQLRKWPLNQYVALATYLESEKKMNVVFCGDKNDLGDITKIQEMISFKTYSVAGTFSLSEFSSLVSKASLFVGNESGPLHIASVAGVSSLGLFGPGEPHVFYPRGKKTAYVHQVLECNPCGQVHCVHPENPCIQRITLEEVKSKVEALLK